MPVNLSVMSLHLRYRLWIAEMNSDINVLRIFDDYLTELEAKKNEPEVSEGINHFKQQFVMLRTEIDELRHEMHLIKMKLAALAKENLPLDSKPALVETQAVLQKRYAAFNKTFNKIKKEFGLFEGKWLN